MGLILKIFLHDDQNKLLACNSLKPTIEKDLTDKLNRSFWRFISMAIRENTITIKITIFK